MDASSNRATKYKNQKLKEVKGEIDESTLRVRNVNTPLPEMDRSSRQKISKHMIEFNNTINQLCITDIYGLLHPEIPGD